MQGYDSVAMGVDVEIGGTDQTFNMLAGRTLSKRLKNKDKFVIAVNLMEDPESGLLMSKSRGTGVFLGLGATEMYRQTMAQPDSMMETLLINCTREPLPLIRELLEDDPLKTKEHIAKKITEIFYGEEAAMTAAADFVRLVRNKELPDDILEISMPQSSYDVGEEYKLVVDAGLAESNSEARRLIDQNAIKLVKGKQVKVLTTGGVHINDGDILQRGKKHFRKLSVKG